MKRGLLLYVCMLTAACRENTAPEAITTTTAQAESPQRESPQTVTPPPAPPAAATTSAPAVEGPKLMPVDEGSSDPSFVAYRNQLLEAVRGRNAEALVVLVDPKIRTSFGDGGGADEFRKSLQKEGMWENLDTALSRGGKFLDPEKRAFWAPYVYSAWPDDRDGFQSFAVIGENVPLRQSKDPASPVIATLSYDIVERTEVEGQIKTADGKTGFVEPKLLWSPVGYRAGFNRTNGQWRMNAFVAGD
ncbi:MAG TPA: hypothetical protein VE010_03215 [Thermoanaerobaculia bacterium]|nr:hypothetical protein [Thermoanaerobaculia bacterium]